MLLLLLAPAALALPMDFLLADDPFIVSRLEESFKRANPRFRPQTLTDGAQRRCLDAPVLYYATDAVAQDLGAVSALTRCWLPDVPVEEVMNGASPAAAKGCFVHIHENGAEYACADGPGTLVLSVETPAAVSEAWVAARFARRATLTGSTVEQSFAALSGPATLWMRLGEAPEAAMLGGQAKATQAIRYADPTQQVPLWRAGRQESEAGILVLDPSVAELSDLVLGVRADGQLAAIGDLTPRGVEIWSQLQPVRLPRWTGPAHDLRLEVGADVGAMVRLGRDQSFDVEASRDLMKACGSICGVTQLFGAPVSTILSKPAIRDIGDADGLMALWTLDKAERDLHVVTRTAAHGDLLSDPTIKGLVEQLPSAVKPVATRKRGAVIVETGEPHWGRPATVAPGVRFTILDPSDKHQANRVIRNLSHLPLPPDRPLTFELTRRGTTLVVVTNGAEIRLPDTSTPGGQPWTSAEGYRCVRELVEQDPFQRPIDWELTWLADDIPALVEQSMSRAAACSALSPENQRLIENLEAGYQTLLGLYLLEHARFSDAAAPLQAGCVAGEWLACQASLALPERSVSVALLPKAPDGLHPAPASAPVWSLARGKITAADWACDLADRACLAGRVGHSAPLLVVEPDTTAGEVAGLLGALETDDQAAVAWLAGWDGVHLVARQLRLEQADPGGQPPRGDEEVQENATMLRATEPDGAVSVAPERAASALLTLNPGGATLWFAVKGAR